MKLITAVAINVYATLSLNALSLSKEQIENISIAYQVGKTMRINGDAITFENTLAGIILAESSGGIDTVDKLYDSIGPFQIRPATAERVIRERLPQFQYMLKDRKVLLMKLLNNTRFSAIIAGNYLIMCYEEAQKRKMWNPWYKAVSRYNGGWSNNTYVRKVSRKIKLLKNEGII